METLVFDVDDRWPRHIVVKRGGLTMHADMSLVGANVNLDRQSFIHQDFIQGVTMDLKFKAIAGPDGTLVKFFNGGCENAE